MKNLAKTLEIVKNGRKYSTIFVNLPKNTQKNLVLHRKHPLYPKKLSHYHPPFLVLFKIVSCMSDKTKCKDKQREKEILSSVAECVSVLPCAISRNNDISA